MDEDELRTLQDPTAWDFDDAQVRPPVAGAGAVVAIRFAADEFEHVAKQAAEANLSLTAFIRDAVLTKVVHPSVRDVACTDRSRQPRLH